MRAVVVGHRWFNRLLPLVFPAPWVLDTIVI
jgi:hypothetical protein